MLSCNQKRKSICRVYTGNKKKNHASGYPHIKSITNTWASALFYYQKKKSITNTWQLA